MNKRVYLGLPMLDLSKTVMYEFWYDYIKPKYDENAKLCYMDKVRFMVDLKTNDISGGVDTRFDTSAFELDRSLPKGKNKKVIGLIKDELVEKS